MADHSLAHPESSEDQSLKILDTWASERAGETKRDWLRSESKSQICRSESPVPLEADSRAHD